MATFVDQVTLFSQAGKGGDGCVSVHREKFKPLGGPDGGNGGRGGDIRLVVDPNVTTLLDYHHSPHRRATSGKQGAGDRKDGQSGDDLVLSVPNGTVVLDTEGNQLADLVGNGTLFIAAQGGHGGLGNLALSSSKRRAPGFALLGEPGEERSRGPRVLTATWLTRSYGAVGSMAHERGSDVNTAAILPPAPE